MSGIYVVLDENEKKQLLFHLITNQYFMQILKDGSLELKEYSEAEAKKIIKESARKIKASEKEIKK